VRQRPKPSARHLHGAHLRREMIGLDCRLWRLVGRPVRARPEHPPDRATRRRSETQSLPAVVRGPMLMRCSPSPKPMPPRSALPLSRKGV
jgi:hypothetical protein